jgi:hypothetical protein
VSYREIKPNTIRIWPTIGPWPTKQFAMLRGTAYGRVDSSTSLKKSSGEGHPAAVFVPYGHHSWTMWTTFFQGDNGALNEAMGNVKHHAIPCYPALICIYIYYWLVVEPSEKWWSSSVGMIFPFPKQMESHNPFHGPNHQPDICLCSFRLCSTPGGSEIGRSEISCAILRLPPAWPAAFHHRIEGWATLESADACGIAPANNTSRASQTTKRGIHPAI